MQVFDTGAFDWGAVKGLRYTGNETMKGEKLSLLYRQQFYTETTEKENRLICIDCVDVAKMVSKYSPLSAN